MDELAAEEILINLDRVAERRIKDAIDAGEFDNLEGMGRPLNLEDNPFVPEDMRAALKVLQNSGFAPDWMLLAQEIEADIERLRAAADRHFAYLRARLDEVAADPYAIKRLRAVVEHLKAEHRRDSRRHYMALVEINRKINTFNQTVPIASLLKIPLPVDEEMAAYEDRVPAYLLYV